MNFLLDTDTCSAHMRRPARLAHRFIQHTGGLAIPTIVLAELRSPTGVIITSETSDDW